MTTLVATALMGFFVYSNATVISPDALLKTRNPLDVPAYPTYTVAMTAYNAVPAQTDDDPFTTASGAYSNPEVVAARSVDLADELPFGTVIAITKATSSDSCGIDQTADLIGLRVIADSMHPRKRNQVDILLPTDTTVRVGGKDLDAADTFGFCKGVHIAVVGHVDINHMPKTQSALRILMKQSGVAIR